MMDALFDSSSIFRLVKENKIELLIKGHTTELARYEVGNIFWKEVWLHKRMDAKEAEELLADAYVAISTMDVIEVTNGVGALRVALQNRISFYDASYLFEAQRLKVPFVTDDGKLKKKVGGRFNVVPLDEVLAHS